MNLIFEQSTQNHQCSILPPCDVPKTSREFEFTRAI
jgi:hypothetical protein